ncbi:homocysteine S-methyltransferase family protein [Candidatus Latescibacterota bacterium]
MKFHDLLAEKRIILADGAWGTELAKKGYGGGECPELLNVEHEDVLLEIGASYVESGSDIILTNTFGGSPYKLAKYSVEDRIEELNETGVRISKKAAGDSALVLASIGPTGEFLAPLGLITVEEMTAAFARQVKAFIAGGADGVLIETMTDLGEMNCAIRAVKENCDLPLVCSMTFDRGMKGYATMMGVKPDDAARALEEAGADAVGSNCGTGIENMIEVAPIMGSATGLPLWIKPNAGIPELVDGVTVYRETPDQMASRIKELIEAGARIIGGCCGTTPEHIRKFRKVIDEM